MNLLDEEYQYKLAVPEERVITTQGRVTVPAQATPILFEYRLSHQDSGEILQMLNHTAPQMDEQGKMVSIQGITTDITERKKMKLA